MIRRLAVAGALLGAGLALAEEPDATESADAEASEDDGAVEESDALSRYRTHFDELAERTIGSAAMPVAFPWRRTHVQAAVAGSFLSELNNFDSARLGARVRRPAGGALLELGASWVFVGDTESSRRLALTPYRQAGRPSRLEVDLGVSYPLAEGVVTSMPRFLPAAQLVLSAHAGLRYVYYPGTHADMRLRQRLGALLSPRLSEEELAQLEDRRLDAMQVDEARYTLLVGLGNDVYLQQGVFVSPRVLAAVPLGSLGRRDDAPGSSLGLWLDLSLAVGMSW